MTRPPRTPTCHPGNPHAAKGFCRRCYQAGLYKRNVSFRGQNYNQLRQWKKQGIEGMTLERYQEMLTAQDGKCFLCGRAPVGRVLSVDHNHATGEIRALLCVSCNGVLKGERWGDPAFLRKAAHYLETGQRMLYS